MSQMNHLKSMGFASKSPVWLSELGCGPRIYVFMKFLGEADASGQRPHSEKLG
jgi:hypothetical protein